MPFSLIDDFSSGFSSIKNYNISSTDIFSMSNTLDFTIQTNLDSRNVRDISSQLNNFSQPINLNNLNTTISGSTTLMNNNLTIYLNYDKSDINNYSYFGSLSELIRVEIQNIIQTFPGSLYVDDVTNTPLFTISNYNYDSISNTAVFQVPVSTLVNKFNLNYSSNTNNLIINTGITNIGLNYNNYVVWNLSDEFDIVNFTGSTDAVTGYIYMQTEGNPFPAASGGTQLINFHIKPNYNYYENYINGLEDFPAYLLNRDSTPKYTALFKKPVETTDGNDILVDTFYTWKTTDGYNIDTDTLEFDDYVSDLKSLGKTYDHYKTDLISRFLTTVALKEFDTPDGKMNKLLRIYGREFDEIKKYIDALAYISHTSYNKKDNIPDVLVKNFAKTLGWGVVSTYDENDLMKSFLGESNEIIYSGQTKNLTPVETDIELWRRLIINSGYLFRSKGTRNCINFLFKIIGAPDSLVNFNEYVYLVDKKIDVNSIINNSSLNYPFDSYGFPIVSASTSDLYFQMNGGWRVNVELAPNNDKTLASAIGIHTGNYDNGQAYFDYFRNFDNQKGFDLTRTVDNVKSWTYQTGQTNRTDFANNTNYTIQDSRLTLNSKEASIYLDPAQAIEFDVYQYNTVNDYVINATSLPSPYPDNLLTRNEISNLSFIQYIDLIYSNFINAKNRKVADDSHGSGYPTLRKLYEDYYNVSSPPSNQLNFIKVKKYIDSIGSFWISLIEQFIPSTTIWEGGVLYRNTIFDRQKFVYKHGINDGSEFTTKLNSTTNSNNIYVTSIGGNVNLPYVGNVSNLINSVTSFSSSISFNNNNNVNLNKLKYKPSLNTNIIKIGQPCFVVSGAAKIVSGLSVFDDTFTDVFDSFDTEPIVHNISNGLKELDFGFNCNTNLLDADSNPQTQFRYSIYQFDTVNEIFQTGYTYQYITTNDFVGQTGETRTLFQTIPYNFTDGDYLVKGSFIFSGFTNPINVIPSGYTFIQSAYTIDTGILNTNSLYYQYGSYDENYDYWFTIISNPYTPFILENIYDLSNSGITSFSGLTLVNQQIPLTTSVQNVFVYNDKPVGKIVLNVNGNTILPSSAITFDDGGEYYVDDVTYPTAIVITLLNSLYEANNDVLDIVYLQSSDSNNINNIGFEYQVVNYIPSGSTGYAGAQAFFNTTTSNYEYYFNFMLGIDVDYNQLIVILNGNKLIKNVDYYPSTTNKFAIVFNGVISISDTLLFYYPVNNLIGSVYLESKSLSADWTAFNDSSGGLYTVQVTSGGDINFNNILYTATTIFVTANTLTNNTYNLYVTDITTPNATFLLRVRADKYFTNMVNETFQTTTYSAVLSFKTDNRVLG